MTEGWRVSAFSPDEVAAVICEWSGSSAESPSPQIRYLASYLGAGKSPARTILIEDGYVDRHYLEEYTGYYATVLRPPPPRTRRLHFFACDLPLSGTSPLVERIAVKGPSAVEEELQRDYLGFVVVRPLPSAPIGRTVLRPYQHEGLKRCFEAAQTRHDVHLLGLTLQVSGVPFQQQDQGVAACATTALWSALSRVSRADGGRAATPFAVTSAATRTIDRGRAFPANRGLSFPQMLEAIRHFGYAPDVLDPLQGAALFLLTLKCYLRSGIPVILELARPEEDENHAIAAVGFREADDGSIAEEIEFDHGLSYTLRSTGMSRLYAHDDQFGPYARMIWEARDQTLWLKFKPERPGFESFEQPMRVVQGLAPLYPKLRMPALELVYAAAGLLPICRYLAGPGRRDELLVDVRFVLSGRYLREAHSMGLSEPRLMSLLTGLRLPRYLALIRFSLGDQRFLDVLCDPTDIQRSTPELARVLALIPADPAQSGVLTNLPQVARIRVI